VLKDICTLYERKTGIRSLPKVDNIYFFPRYTIIKFARFLIFG